MAEHPPITPVMQQYHAAKKDHPDCLMLFRLGDFFEFFYDDAVTASKDLQITLTSRQRGKNGSIPMCGVPAQTVQGYLAKLLEKGHRVAICDQIEDARKSQGLVKRAVVRVLTPGTTSDLDLLKANENNYLAAVHALNGTAGMAYVDVSTGEFCLTQLPEIEITDLLLSLGPKEVLQAQQVSLLSGTQTLESNNPNNRFTLTEVDSWTFDFEYAEQILKDKFNLHTLEGLGLNGYPHAVSAAGALLHYLKETQQSALQHLDQPRFFQQKDWMVLDPVTVRHLELVQPQFKETPRSTLFYTLDRTSTSMGARRLRNWILHPSLHGEEIEQRLEAVSSLCRDTIVRSELERELLYLHDIERLLARVTLGTANPRDLYNMGASFLHLPPLRQLASRLNSSRVTALLGQMDSLEDVCQQITKTIAEEPPIQLNDGGVIARGYDEELDQLRDISGNSRTVIAQLERNERRNTGIESLKVRYNSIFGYFIEVSKSNLAKVPDRFTRKQTLTNVERFSTPELKELEIKVLEAEERISTREAELFKLLCTDIAAEAQRIRTTATAIAELDSLRSLSQVAVENDYIRPRFSLNGSIQVEAGRHPVVERMLDQEGSERFVENDTYLDNDNNLLAIITGPNMGGKSTYLRQTALIVIMAQMGSFVPARKAFLPLIDRIFTRIGASDNLALGSSTFMVEMTETSQILNTATDRSLILLDEIGRGTSTYDGLAIAWAVAEHIHNRIHAKTLFATHYHELTVLADALDGIFNLHVSARQSGGKLIFLRRIEAGKADRSYGIEVARLAGVPQIVISRAQAVLTQHENEESTHQDAQDIPERTTQENIFGLLSEGVTEGITEEIRNLDIDKLRPIEALSLLYEWQQKLDPADEEC